MKVAVVIPLYNHERYIGAALDSLRAQTRPPDRLIVLDDGSTDGSLDAVNRLSTDLRIDALTQPNAGAHATLNRLVTLADDCDYVAILNSDDCYHPQRLERCLESLDAHPGVGLLCTRLRVIDETGNALPSDAPRARWFSAAWSFGATAADEDHPPDLVEWLARANFAGTTSNFVARTEWLREHPFGDYRFAHDYHALIHAALENQLAILDEELLDYRVHPSNTISTEPERLIREMLRVNLDLARAVAPRLTGEPALRAAWGRYQRAAWGSVSAFRADLFQVVLGGALAALPGPAADALLAGLDGERFPEIKQFPNRAAVNAHDPGKPGDGLADKFYELKAQLSATRNGARAWAEYRQLQAALLDSRWFALGRLLGVTRHVTVAGGKTGEEKLANLRGRVEGSAWVKWGRRMGFPSATRVMKLAAQRAD